MAKPRVAPSRENGSHVMAFRINDDELARLDKLVEVAAVGTLGIRVTRSELMRRLFLRGMVVIEKEQRK